MSFNSFLFCFLFLPVAVAGYFLVARTGSRAWPKLWLLAVSLVFYSAGRPADLAVLAVSAAMNGFLAPRLAKGAGCLGLSNRASLFLGLSANILLLSWFKYAGFFVTTFDQFTGASFPVPHIAFPLGISFFTVQQIMYLVDSYQGQIDGTNWLDYLVFTSLFSYITMGPIVRWKQVVPQLNEPEARRLNFDNIAAGLYIFLIGLFKKAVLSSTFFRWADAGFSYNSPLSLVGGWIAALSFTFQLYFDFSGYTDMAIGGALMFNISLPPNFEDPFKATSITEFWRRWHMTLTNFITGYLYTPILRAMSKITLSRAMMATFLAMLIAGLWHGPAWTFIIYGGVHGVALALAQWWRKKKLPMPDSLGWFLTFTFVVCSLVFFRSGSVTQALGTLASMFSVRGGVFSYVPWTGIDHVDHLAGLFWMVCGIAVVIRGRNSLALRRDFRPSWAMVGQCVALACISFIYVNGVISRSFVYRDF